jgi:hypothetical protein
MKKIQLLLFSLTFISLTAQVSTSGWDFPVKPGSEKWKSLKSHTEMVEICQIPDNLIHSLSTKDLIDVCLNYPLFFSLTAFNNMQEGFEQVSTEFNGFKELYQRKDFGKELFILYQNIRIDDVKTLSTNLDKGRYMFRTFYLELMLAQNNVFNNLSNTELNELLVESFQKAKQKQESKYSVFQIQASYLVIGRILDFNKYDGFVRKVATKPDVYAAFLKRVFLEDKGILTEIENSATEYIKEL